MKKIKRFSALLLVLCMLLTMLPTAAVAAEENAVLTGIEIASMPWKLSYWQGEDLDLAGLIVTATYSDGAVVEITEDLKISGYNKNQLGTQFITITYQGATAEFWVDVQPLMVTGIEIKSYPIQLEYWVGEELDTTGLALNVFYSDGTVREITEGFSIHGFEAHSPGERLVTVCYEGRDAHFSITVKDSAVSNVEMVSSPRKTEYWVGEALDTNGLVLVVFYNDGSVEEITDGYEISGYDPFFVGQQTITVSYQGISTFFDIYVNYADVVGIEIATMPHKTEYWVGEELDTTGLTLLATYSNGNTAIISDGFTVEEFSSAMAGRKTLVVLYGEASVEFTVTVQEPYLNALFVNTPPNKYEYWAGEPLDTTGLTLTATYADGSIKIIESGFEISGFDSSIGGYQTITVTYQGYCTTFSVNVNIPYLMHLQIETYPEKMEYWVGEELDTTGLTLRADYSDGKTLFITDGFMLHGFESSYAGDKWINVEFDGGYQSFMVTVREPYATEIRINSLPYKTQYFVGDMLDFYGLTLWVSYSDGTEAIITDSFEISGFDCWTPGEQIITVCCEGLTETFKVYVYEPEIVGVELYSAPNKTEYWVGESLDTEGLILKVVYESGYEELITEGFTVSGFNSAAAGPRTITVTYQGFAAAFTVTISKVTMTGIAIGTMPEKTQYWVGEALDTTGLSLLAVYSDGHTETISSGFRASGFSSTTPGEKTVSVMYGGKTATFTVMVKVVEAVRIEIASFPEKTEYWVGEALDTTGLVLAVYYADDSVKEILSGFTVSGFDSSVSGWQEVAVTYENLTASFGVNVNVPTIMGVSVKSYPVKREYWVGEELDATGLVVTVAYSDGSFVDLTEGFQIHGFESGMSGEKWITIHYEGHTASFTVHVNAPVLTGIEIATLPHKTEYWVGEGISDAGLSLRATYSDGHTEEITMGFEVDVLDSTTSGEKVVSVYYGDQVTTFTVWVKDPVLTGIEITVLPQKTEYWIGETLDLYGMVLWAVYSNEQVEVLTEGFAISGFSSATPGEKTVVLSYNGHTASFTILVKEPGLREIELEAQPQKTTYWIGEELDLTGMILWAKYEDGRRVAITDGYTVSGYDSHVSGPQCVVIAYGGMTVSFEIYIDVAVPISISVQAIPAKVEYWLREELDTTGLVIRVYYSDGSFVDMTEGFEIYGFDNSTDGPKDIVIFYEGHTTSYGVTVKAPVLTGITVVNLPVKTEYLVGEPLETAGLTLLATYSDGSTQYITEGFDCFGFDSETVGTQEITVSYGGVTTLFTVQVILTGVCGTDLYWTLDGEGSLTIFGTGTYIDDYAFEGNCDIRSVVILANVTAIGEFAFNICSQLQSVTLPEGLESIGMGAFYGCEVLQSIVIPDSVTELALGAFCECYSLQSVTLSKNITSIEDVTFGYCVALERVVIPEGATRIGSMAFVGCGNLREVTIPASMEAVGEFAFFYCDAITDIYYGGSIQQWTQIQFESTEESIEAATIHYAKACSHTDVENGVCVYCKEAIVAALGDSNGNLLGVYTTVADAFAAANAGDMVVLIADAEAENLILPAGVILEMNGHALTVNSILTYGNSQIQDSSEKNTGVLKILDADGNMISQFNSHLPVYDSTLGGYRFFAVKVTPKAITGGSKYWFSVEVENFDQLHKLIQSGADVRIQVKMTWDGQSQPVYATADLAFTTAWANRYAENSNSYITVSVTENEGVENFILTPSLISGGVEISGEAM